MTCFSLPIILNSLERTVLLSLCTFCFKSLSTGFRKDYVCVELYCEQMEVFPFGTYLNKL